MKLSDIKIIHLLTLGLFVSTLVLGVMIGKSREAYNRIDIERAVLLDSLSNLRINNQKFLQRTSRIRDSLTYVASSAIRRYDSLELSANKTLQYMESRLKRIENLSVKQLENEAEAEYRDYLNSINTSTGR